MEWRSGSRTDRRLTGSRKKRHYWQPRRLTDGSAKRSDCVHMLLLLLLEAKTRATTTVSASTHTQDSEKWKEIALNNITYRLQKPDFSFEPNPRTVGLALTLWLFHHQHWPDTDQTLTRYQILTSSPWYRSFTGSLCVVLISLGHHNVECKC